MDKCEGYIRGGEMRSVCGVWRNEKLIEEDLVCGSFVLVFKVES